MRAGRPKKGLIRAKSPLAMAARKSEKVERMCDFKSGAALTILVLQVDPIANGTQVVSQMQTTGGLDPGKDTLATLSLSRAGRLARLRTRQLCRGGMCRGEHGGV